MSESSSTSGFTRLHALDSLRATMMLLGIWLHATCSYVKIPLGAAWPFKDADTSALLGLSLVLIHVFRMPLFFVLAGFFGALLWTRLETKKFAQQRAVRILVPFLAGWFLFYLPVTAGFAYASFLTSPDPLAATVEFFRSGAILTILGTGHLWFLYYLLYLYVAAVTIARAAQRALSFRTQTLVQSWFRRIAGSAWRPLILAIPTCATLYFMRSGGLDTEVGFLITPKVLAAYGVFFGFGWMLYGSSDLLPTFQQHAWKQVILALLILPVNGAALTRTLKALPAYDAVSHTVAMISGSVMVWLLIFGLTGLFIKHQSAPSKRIRYVADASYWMYLVHLPFMIWIPVLLSPVRLHALIKVGIVLGITVPILFLTYHYLVRFTFVGLILNGRRYSRTVTTQEQVVRAAGA